MELSGRFSLRPAGAAAVIEAEEFDMNNFRGFDDVVFVFSALAGPRSFFER